MKSLFLNFLLIGGLVLNAVGSPAFAAPEESSTFVIAVIPDTQNMVDYSHQQGQPTAGGKPFPFDASEQFLGMMRYIAGRSTNRGGDIVFAAAVGDVWQHQTEVIDQDHAARGFAHNPRSPLAMSGAIYPTEETLSYELPKAIEGYRILAEADLPFGVAPGNHDYDAMWPDVSFPGDPARLAELRGYDPDILGMIHIGGLSNFNRVFGAEGEFFADKPWYVSSFNGGANSAQVFSAGGYRFLHIALEMHAPDTALAWAQSVIERFPGLPTIVNTHDYLNTRGERAANPLVDLARIDPDHHNSAEQLFEKLIAPNDQVFMVLCGHHHGQSQRIDDNRAGNKVYQLLADYQSRGQSVLDVDPDLRTSHDRPYSIGDGWLRLMQFDMGAKVPTLTVSTYSSFYERDSQALPEYAQWYRDIEQPGMSDADFRKADSFVIQLEDFQRRFGKPAAAR